MSQEFDELMAHREQLEAWNRPWANPKLQNDDVYELSNERINMKASEWKARADEIDLVLAQRPKIELQDNANILMFSVTNNGKFKVQVGGEFKGNKADALALAAWLTETYGDTPNE